MTQKSLFIKNRVNLEFIFLMENTIISLFCVTLSQNVTIKVATLIKSVKRVLAKTNKTI